MSSQVPSLSLNFVFNQVTRGRGLDLRHWDRGLFVIGHDTCSFCTCILALLPYISCQHFAREGTDGSHLGRSFRLCDGSFYNVGFLLSVTMFCTVCRGFMMRRVVVTMMVCTALR
jgi:hypothetical protein